MPQCYWNYRNIVLGFTLPAQARDPTKNYSAHDLTNHTPSQPHPHSPPVFYRVGGQRKPTDDEQGSIMGIFRCPTLTNPHFCLPNTGTPIHHPPPLKPVPSDDTVTQKVPAYDSDRTLRRTPESTSPDNQSFAPASIFKSDRHLPQKTNPTGTANIPAPHLPTFLQQELDLDLRIALHPTQMCIKVGRC